jgi:hypothetical protein
MTNFKNKTIYVIIFAFILHISFINFYPVNFEFVFYEGYNFIKEDFNKEIARNFFEQQANTFFFTFIISFFSFLFPFAKPIYIGKFISALSYLFIGLSFINISNKFEKKNTLDNFRSILLLLLFLSPIIWIFGYRSTPDLISMSLGLYGFSIFYKYEHENKLNNLVNIFLPSFIMGFATALKPIVGIYLIASVCIMQFDYNKIFLYKKLFLIGLFYSIVPIIYFYCIYINFNFLLFTPYYKEVLSVVKSLHKYVSNIILYTSFLWICILPIIIGRFVFTIKSLSNLLKVFHLVIIISFFFIGNRYLDLSVEMSFGILDKLIKKEYLRGILCIISYFLIFLVFSELKKLYFNKNIKKFNLLLTGILYILIISFSLASQRYLIVIVPLFYFIFGEYYKNKLNFLFVIIICIPANIVFLGNQYLTGSLANKLIQIIKKENFINKTCVGAIGSHASEYFPIQERLAKNCAFKDFHVIEGIDLKSLYSVKGNFLFINKAFSLIKVR